MNDNPMNNQPHDPRMVMSPDEYQDHMDALAKKIGAVLVGHRVEDGIIACSAVAAFGMVQLNEDQREKMRAHISSMTDEILVNTDIKVASARATSEKPS